MKISLLVALVVLCPPVWAQNPVKVHVVDDKNSPVAGALVEVQIWIGQVKPIPALVTDANGNALFSLAQKLDPKRATGTFLVAAKGFAFAGAPVNSANLEVQLQKGAILRGQVLDEAGKPVAGAQVQVNGAMKDRDFSTNIGVYGERIAPLYATKTDAEGRFQVADVPAKINVRFSIEHSRYALGSGRTTPDIEAAVRLAPGGTVHGRLLDLAGKPLAKIVVYASPMEIGEGGNEATTDEKGFFTVTGLKPGFYRVGAQMEFFGESPGFVFPKVANLQVEAGKEVEVADVRAVAGVEIHGVVRDAATKLPLAGAFLNARQKHDTSGSGFSDATGHFSIRVLPGVHQVYVSGAPEGYFVPTEQPTVDLSEAPPDKIAPEISFDLKKVVVLRGLAVDEAGKPLAAPLIMGWGGDGEISSDAAGKWEYTPRDEQNLSILGGENEDGYFEVIDPKPIEAPFPAQVVIRMRRVAWKSVAGRVLDTAGAPVAGVKIEGVFSIPLGEGSSTSRTRNVVSDAQGRFVLPKMRDNRITVSGKKDGFAFRSGGEAKKVGVNWTVSDLVFASLNHKIEGTTVPGARVVAAGREVLADATGHFVLEGLPQSDIPVFAAKAGQFGAVPQAGEAPLKIELYPQGLQGVDAELGREIWRQTAQDPRSAKYYALDWLTAKTDTTTHAEDFEAVKREAQEPPTPAHDWQLAALVKQWAPKLPAEGRVEALEVVIKGIATPEIALMAWLDAANSAADVALSKRAVAASIPVLQARVSDFNDREWNLYRLAVATERAEGEAAGATALDRAIAWTMTHHGAKAYRENGQYVEGGRDEYLKLGAEFIGAGSDALIHRLIGAIDPETGYDVQALAVAIPLVARVRGAEAALPLLDELLKMPTPLNEGRKRILNNDPTWAFGQAARRVIALLGAKSPQKALDLARRVTTDSHRARALAAAARFQSGEAATKLWREALADANPEDAPRFAAAVWEIDPKLGADLFETARTRIAAAMSERYVQRNLWPTFAFYFARVDAAQSRLILEREWTLAQEKQERRGSIARAMSAIDARRADEMARQIADKDFESPEARRKIGQYLQTSEALRRDLPFDRWGASDTWSPGDEEW